MYSLSTCWNSHRHTDGREMLREIRALGFDHAELSHGVSASLVPGIYDAVDAGEIKISSLHNFCPLPLGVTRAAPNIFQFTADDERERESAWRHTCRTIEMAARVQAQVVVLHLGSIEMGDYTDRLLDLLAADERGGKRYQKLRADLEGARARRKARHVERALAMLKRIAEPAAKAGVKLGVENREALEEIPLEDDFGFLWEEDFIGDTVGYWHDTGHAQIKENLGFIRHTEHLESLAPRLHGFHVHDVRYPGRDHRAPGTGMIDFAALAPQVLPGHIKVLELSPSVPPDEVLKSFAYIKSLWGDE